MNIGNEIYKITWDPWLTTHSPALDISPRGIPCVLVQGFHSFTSALWASLNISLTLYQFSHVYTLYIFFLFASNNSHTLFIFFFRLLLHIFKAFSVLTIQALLCYFHRGNILSGMFVVRFLQVKHTSF